MAESRPKSHNLTELEEEVLIQYIIDMDDRGFAPKLNSVEDMANYMLETRGAKKVGKLWAHRFVKRCSELKMRFNRVYDFQRALCEDPELIEDYQIEGFIKAHINHISKVEFFIAFKAAYQQSITIQNIKAGFREAGLIPFDPQSILSKLDIRIRTSTPPSTSLELTNFWISQTPHNPTEALLQSTLVKARMARHQSSSSIPIFETVQALAKGTERLAYEVTLLSAENLDAVVSVERLVIIQEPVKIMQ
ncbi:hypothetical protein SS1G_08697 [Sclerotinia sclerotiorum 1980 UF-70]|uniref:HTH CENPB-type domain-containing protein n=1 Tax=Sclerotinia sclerotiorum (strain ATCC 18683 / 1980 / Ss-1) TaxID=665079 RepID=A7ETP0_SCLS1|nr:hypothetical protein SS1G_08697 [Sclerotinia sclerotiorum 1980 UF-70]EDN92832.1 hypothetical protein SS1G_08697 [Sclerotinia sclerotiorum 1980 UF-70]